MGAEAQEAGASGRGEERAAAWAATIIATFEAWRAVGAEIERLERKAIVALAAATSPAAAAAAAAVAWPSP